MKIAGRLFGGEEIALCAALLVFFGWIFAGAFGFEYTAALFPFMLSIPGFALVVLYLLRGTLPEAVERAMTSNDRFAIGKRPETIAETTGKGAVGDVTQDDTPAPPNARPYFVFAYAAGYGLVAWAAGFYIAAIAAVAVYVLTVRNEERRPIMVAVVLLLLGLGITALFDTAFGHHYGQGAFVSLF